MFKCLFKPYVIDIQNHGRAKMAEYVDDNVNDAYLEKDSRTFLCSDLLRSQFNTGLLISLKERWSFIGNFNEKRFSDTGAARTAAMDVNKLVIQSFLTGKVEIPDMIQHIFDR